MATGRVAAVAVVSLGDGDACPLHPGKAMGILSLCWLFCWWRLEQPMFHVPIWGFSMQQQEWPPPTGGSPAPAPPSFHLPLLPKSVPMAHNLKAVSRITWILQNFTQSQNVDLPTDLYSGIVIFTFFLNSCWYSNLLLNGCVLQWVDVSSEVSTLIQRFSRSHCMLSLYTCG